MYGSVFVNKIAMNPKTIHVDLLILLTLATLTGHVKGQQSRTIASDLRLIGGATAAEGRLEVFQQGQWGTVCDANPTNDKADTLCRLLGFRMGSVSALPFPSSPGEIWLQLQRSCPMVISNIEDCATNVSGRYNCTHSDDLHLQCRSSCSPNPCHNGGSCGLFSDNSYKCVCDHRFTGDKCETEFDACADRICLNGGICELLQSVTRCHCRDGFTGAHCESDVNECLSEPCLNNGVCVNEVNKYRCHCLADWMGMQCETAGPMHPHVHLALVLSSLCLSIILVALIAIIIKYGYRKYQRKYYVGTETELQEIKSPKEDNDDITAALTGEKAN